MSGFNLHLKPTGPVGAGFIGSFASVRMIMGPIGSGKTSLCMWDIVQKSCLQPKSPIDGYRHAKWAIIRDTYRNLAKTTIPSWNTWFPKSEGKWTGGGAGDPAKHELVLNFGGAIGKVKLIVEFIALGENSVEDVMRGWEGTGVYLNEADRLAYEVFTFARGRVGRYPSKAHGGCGWYGVILDMNAPDVDNWTYLVFVEEKPTSFEFYRQPGGLIKTPEGYRENPEAENIRNLPKGYYLQQAEGQPDWYIRRMILNEFGYSREGKPVYEEFNDALHVAKADLIAVKGLKLIVGLDAGMTPAASIRQRMPDGQWWGLGELVMEHCGPQNFATELNQYLNQVFPGFGRDRIDVFADPSSQFGGDDKDLPWMLSVAKHTGLRIKAAPSNNLHPRLDAVRGPLSRMIDGRKPGYLLSPTCRIMRKAFNSGYQYKRIQGTNGQYQDQPLKNEFSHVMDADQYAALGGGEYSEVMGRKSQAALGSQPIVIQSNFNPFD